jgi:hypothetical protein
MIYVPQNTPEQTGADKAPQEQAENSDKAVKPANGEKKMAVNPSAGKKKGRAAQARPARPPNAMAATGGKGVAQ